MLFLMKPTTFNFFLKLAAYSPLSFKTKGVDTRRCLRSRRHQNTCAMYKKLHVIVLPRGPSLLGRLLSSLVVSSKNTTMGRGTGDGNQSRPTALAALHHRFWNLIERSGVLEDQEMIPPSMVSRRYELHVKPNHHTEQMANSLTGNTPAMGYYFTTQDTPSPVDGFAEESAR